MDASEKTNIVADSTIAKKKLGSSKYISYRRDFLKKKQ